MSSIHAFMALGSRKSTCWGLAADCNVETFVGICWWEVGGEQRQEGNWFTYKSVCKHKLSSYNRNKINPNPLAVLCLGVR